MITHLSHSDISFSTLVELLHHRALHEPERQIYTFLTDGNLDAIHLTFGQLERQARAVASLLQRMQLVIGERALLLYPPGLDYIAALFGCLFAGVVAIPAYPPDLARLNRTFPRLLSIIKDAQPTVVLTTSVFLQMAQNLFDQAPGHLGLHWLATDDLSLDSASEWKEPSLTDSALALLQYTSGSTSTPKGVMLTHSNLLHNSAYIQRCFDYTSRSQGVIWLPPYHDMGLIGGILQPLYGSFPVTLMSPVTFLHNPFLWLQAISHCRATISGGPNFAYDLCVRKTTLEQRLSLDLSSWEVAFSGAELVRPETIDRFVKAFETCGFRREAFYPCYGLAEATLLVSGGSKKAAPVIITLERDELKRNAVREAVSGSENSRSLVGCGRSPAEQKIRIVAPESLRQLQPEQIGEIWVSGPCVAQGYWNQVDETRCTFYAYLADTGEGPFLRTGDLGFLKDGELFITGRLKDQIIIRGRNYYPEDIEHTIAQCHSALRPIGAAFSIDVAEEERLVVTQELSPLVSEPDIPGIVAAIRQAVAEQHELQVYAVSLLRAGSIPKTSSGKIQRYACRDGFLSGTLDVMAQSSQDGSSANCQTQHTNDLSLEALMAATEETRRMQLECYLRLQAARVLRVPPEYINLQRSLGALGIDSLMAVEMKNEIESVLGVVVPMADFFQAPDMSHLAAEICAQLSSPTYAASTTISAAPYETETAQPLSYGQRALWFMHQLAPESAAYNIAGAVRILAEVDTPRLRRTFQSLVDRHASLRVTFPARQGQPIQKVSSNVDVCFHAHDASNWTESTLNERLLQEACTPFDLAVGPLLRVTLFSKSAREHILIVVVHHIVSDLWSISILVNEFIGLYTTGKTDALVSRTSGGAQYADYVQQQDKMVNGPEGEQLWAYWRKQLTDASFVLNLPFDRPHLPTQTYRGSTFHFNISAQVCQQLKSLAQSHGTTLYTVLLAAFQVLLYRNTGQEDILVGSPTLGRSSVSMRDIVGYFVNPVVLRASLAGLPTFATFLDQVRQTVLDAFAHQDYPFPLIIERLQLERDPSRSPLFQVMFVWQKAHLLDDHGLTALALGVPGAQMKVGGLTLESVCLDPQAAQFDLTLVMAEVEGELAASLQYNVDLFDVDTIAQMAGHYQTLLEGIVADPDRPVSALPLLSSAEENRLLVEWNNTSCDFPQDVCVHQLFEAQVARSPETTAVVFQGTRLSYRELNERANQVAHYLQKLGVGPEERVGIFVEPSLHMMVGLFGILKAGGAYVPLDAMYPAKRLGYMLNNARVSVIVTQSSMLSMLPAHDAVVVCLDSDWDKLQQESTTNTVSGAMPENLSHVIYTSGSTGRPKGAMVKHGSVINLRTAIHEAIYTQYGERRLQVGLIAPLSFDGSIREYLLLLDGHTIHLLPKEFRTDGDALLAYLSDNAIDEFYCTPSQLKLLISAGLLEGRTSRLSLVLLGGEPIGSHMWQLLSRCTNIAFYNIYGPTECTVDSTLCRVDTSITFPAIGRPIANTRIYILDDELRPVPVGVPGQVYIGGIGLARGYIGQPDLTAEKFIPDPFSDKVGERLYKTGDLARYRSDGNIEFIGRIDHQVKIRGFTVDLEEIECVLCEHPGIQETVVMVREDMPENTRLVAYFVSKRVPPPAADELRVFLKERLPSYMVPSAFVALGLLPLTPNGKVDRQALPEPNRSRPELNAVLAAPSTAVEQTLVDVWIQVLGIEQVGVNDNFFELGGTSLSIIRVHALAQERLELEFPAVKLFQYPTIRLLADYLTGTRGEQLSHINRSRHIAARRQQRLSQKRSDRRRKSNTI